MPIRRVVEAAQIPWRPIGELFVERGLVSEEQIEQALAEQAATGLRLGEILVRRNLISSPELTQALMEQLGREVAREDGFGTGLWSEIRRRNARPGAMPDPSPVDDDRSSFGDALARKIGATREDRSEPEPEPETTEFDDAAFELDEADVEEIRLEMHQLQALDGKAASEPAPVDERLREGHREVEVLRERVSEREQSLAGLQAEIASLRATKERQDLEARKGGERLEHDLTAAHSDLRVQAVRVAELEAALLERDDRDEQLRRLLTEAEGARDELSERVAELAAARERDAAEREHDLHVARDQISKLGASVSELSGQAVRLEATLDEEREAHGRTRHEFEHAFAEAAQARDSLQELRRDNANLRAECDTAHTETESTRHTLAELEQQQTGLGDQLIAAQEALETERDAHKRTRHDSEHALAEVVQARGALQELRRDYDNLQAERDTAHTETESTRHTLAEVEQQLSDLNGQLTVAQATLHEERDGHERTQRDSEHAFAEVARARGTIEQLEADLGAARSERDDLLTELGQARLEAIEFEQEKVELTGRLQESARERDEAQSASTELEERLAIAGNRAEELSAHVGKLGEQLRALESELAGEREAHASTGRGKDEAAAKLRKADARITELTATVDQLDAERTELTVASADQRAALELRLADVESRLAEEAASHSETRRVLAQALEELAGKRAVSAGVDDEPAENGHLCFTSGGDGYQLIHRTGPLPAAGEHYDLDGTAQLVTRIGRSPLPFDHRRCVYLVSAPSSPPSNLPAQ